MESNWSNLKVCGRDSQIYKGDPITCAIIIQTWGAQTEGIQAFAVIKITVICQVHICMYCYLSIKINMLKMLHNVKIVNLFCLHLFLLMWLAKT